MIRKIEEAFLWVAAVILVLKAVAELSSIIHTAQLLNQPDPLLLIPSYLVLALMGFFELLLSAYLLMGQNKQLKMGLTALLATGLLVYRIGLHRAGAPIYGDCLGNFNDWLPIHPRILHVIMVVMAGFLMVGSYVLLILGWLPYKKRAKTAFIKSGANEKP
jgi:hypothetical protein